MTPKEKAEQLYFDFSESLWYSTEKDKHLNAKQCALIAVNEILDSIDFTSMLNGTDDYNYWNEVKQQIEKL